MNRDHAYLVCGYALIAIPSIALVYDREIFLLYITRPILSYVMDYQSLTDTGRILYGLAAYFALVFNALVVIQYAKDNLRRRSQAEYLSQASEE